MRTRIPVTAFLWIYMACLTNAAIEFSGYTQTGRELKFVLVDSEAKQSSGWLQMGGTFREYKLIGFDRKGEVLSVQKDDVTLHLPLRTSRMAISAVAMELSTASAELAAWMKAVEPPLPSGTQRTVSNSPRPPPSADERKIRAERKAKVAQLLTPFHRAYLNGRDGDVRHHLKTFGILVDATGRAFISPEMNDPTKINQTKTMMVVDHWNGLVPKPPSE